MSLLETETMKAYIDRNEMLDLYFKAHCYQSLWAGIMPRIEVPLFLQPRPDYCVPTCIKMVLESLRLKHGEKVPRLSIKTIARIVKTEVGRGTSFDDIPRVNTRMLPSIPSLKFYAEFPCPWDDIIRENKEEKPIIAWMWLPNSKDPTGERGCGHSVVITDLDLSLGEIYYNDPIKGVCQEDMGKFISKWEHEAVNRSLIRVEVGERAQRDLSEYSIEFEKEEEPNEHADTN
jgi:hypothetical protein